MYKLAIVDDEPNLVEGLFDLLSTELSQETEIFKAYSAADICDLLQTVSLDLIISDIRMPGMSGLEMLGQVEAFCPSCRVIFLTGYDTFDWAREALRHVCCVDYLLKTQGDAVILAAIEKQLKQLNQENDPVALKQRLSAQIEALRPFVRQHEMTLFLTQGGVLPKDTHLSPSLPCRLCLCRRKEGGALKAALPAVLEQLLQENIPFSSRMEVVPIGWEEYGCLFQCRESDREIRDMRVFLRARLEKVQHRLEELGEMIDFAFSCEALDLKAAPQKVSHLETLLRSFGSSDEQLILDEALLVQPHDGQDESGIVPWIEQYIAEHLADLNLSLTTIATQTFYSPTYLSRLFKQKTGLTLSNYIARIRLEAACRLLREERRTAREVGQMVGFESPSYFSVFFKRQTGLTPSEYMRKKDGR